MSTDAADAGVAPTGVQSVDRAITVLEILAREDGAAVGDVALELGVHKSTASRLLSALEERDLVETDGERGRYRLGVGLLRLAGHAAAHVDLAGRAHTTMRRLALAVGETVNLAVLRGHHAVNVADVHGPAAITARNWIGHPTPLHATASGKVLLAHEDPAVRRTLLDAAGLPRFTSHTVTSRRVLAVRFAELLASGSSGWATAVEEYEVGLTALACAVRDHTGRVVAALSVSGPTYRLDPARLLVVAPVLLAAGADISARLGHST